MKLSKSCKQRLKRCSKSELKAIEKALTLLADNEIISSNRWNAAMRVISSQLNQDLMFRR
jgi:hypothetical protein|tara:strand:+ start:1291 stop:1470 length:180 start_codon:yes stop_codon:yes gene_type:complete